MASPIFTINGAAVSGAKVVAYASTVTLALVSVVGVSTVAWAFLGRSNGSQAYPTITPGGSPIGATASFTMPADPGDDLGRGFRLRCTVTDGLGNTSSSTVIVGAVNATTIVPIVPGETSERSGEGGWAFDVNAALASGGSSGVVALVTDSAVAAAADNVFHCHFDGTDAGTTYTDVSGGTPLTLVNVGAAALTTTGPKFGTACLNIGNSSSNYVYADHGGKIAFGRDDWTIECWCNIAGTTGDGRQALVCFAPTAGSDTFGPYLFIENSGRPAIYTSDFLGGAWTNTIQGDSTIAALGYGTWHHIAATRQDGVLALWVNGTKQSSVIKNDNPICTAARMNIGRLPAIGGCTVNGKIDEVRISKVARYTTDFTPSASAFGDMTGITAGVAGESRTDGGTAIFDCLNATSQAWKRRRHY